MNFSFTFGNPVYINVIVYLRVRVCVYMFVQLYVCVNGYVGTLVRASVYVRTCMYVCCVYKCAHVHEFFCECVYLFVCVCGGVNESVYAYLCKH